MTYIVVALVVLCLLYKVRTFLYLITKQQGQFLENKSYAKISFTALTGVMLSAATSHYLFFSNIDYPNIVERLLLYVSNSSLPTVYYLLILKLALLGSGVIPFLLLIALNFLFYFIINKYLAKKAKIESGAKIMYSFFLGAQIIPVIFVLPPFNFINNLFGNIVWPETKGVSVLLVTVMSVLVSYPLFIMSNQETRKRLYAKFLYTFFAGYFVFLMVNSVIMILNYQAPTE